MKTKLNIRRGRWNWYWNDSVNHSERIHLANGIRPESWLSNPSQFRFSFGAYGWTKVRVWAKAGDYDSALEIASEWLDDHAPGHLIRLTKKDWKEAAEELGLDADTEDENEQEEIRTLAEADLIVIGHTTLKHGQYIAAWECQVEEITR